MEMYYSHWICWAAPCVCVCEPLDYKVFSASSVGHFLAEQKIKVSISHQERHSHVLCNSNEPLSSRLVASSILHSGYIWLNQNANWMSGRLIWFPKNPETETLLVTSNDGR